MEFLYNSKGNLFSAYTFHLFGDPAMILQLSKYNNNLINDNIQVAINDFIITIDEIKKGVN